MAFKYGFLMYSELVRKVMDKAIISSPTAEIITSGKNLQSNQTLLQHKPGTRAVSYRKMKLKLLTMSSKTYSGRNLKASGCSVGRGNLIE